MREFFSTLIAQLEEELHHINQRCASKQQEAEEAYRVTDLAHERLKAFVTAYIFKSQEEEIHYFKVLKPQVSAKLIYFLQVFHIETKRPQGSRDSLKNYFLNEQNKLTLYFENNIAFISYYRSQHTYLDSLYFLRSNAHLQKTLLDLSYLTVDRTQSTGYDHEVARMLANDMLQAYLEEEMNVLNSAATLPKNSQILPKLCWTDSKTAMIELIYALHVCGSLDNGKAEIKDIAVLCERVFHVDLGDYYRTYTELRSRKTGRTKYLDALRERLIRKMDDQDA